MSRTYESLALRSDIKKGGDFMTQRQQTLVFANGAEMWIFCILVLGLVLSLERVGAPGFTEHES